LREPGRTLGIKVCEGAVHRCNNKCVFCFVDQLPRGLRKPLYVKDGDYRYSFLQGNFITGSNLSRRHLERIVRMGLSPLYFSVHATEPEVRSYLLGDCGERDVIPLVKRLAAQGIEFHFQVVLCPGINDGRVLDKTITDLEALGSRALSMAVVPVGLTAHREQLPRLAPVTSEDAVKVLQVIQRRQLQFRSSRDSRFVYAADEFYLLAGGKIPSQAAYEGYPQLENGVGLVRREIEAFKRAAARKRFDGIAAGSRCLVVTGKLFESILSGLLSGLKGSISGVFEIVPVQNKLLGESITVAGLLAGGDILEAVGQHPPADAYLIPGAALNEDNLFIDNLSLSDLRQALSPGRVIVASGFSQAVAELVALAKRGGVNKSC
jgi:putative radical SAM enzyme (TIGR03279 family)